MARLKLISLQCQATEDYAGADEAYLRVNGRTVWGVQSMNYNDSADLTAVNESPFSSTASISLYDADSGGWWDKDDHLGTITAKASQAGKGEQEGWFTDDGASYRLIYLVNP